MGESAVQAAYDLQSAWNVPAANTELTSMIGRNDNFDEQFTLADVDPRDVVRDRARAGRRAHVVVGSRRTVQGAEGLGHLQLDGTPRHGALRPTCIATWPTA